jgi:hypothetical protein
MAAGWEARQNGDGTFDLTLNGRGKKYDLDDIDEVMKVIRRSPDKEDLLTVIDVYGGRDRLRVR